MATKNTHWKIIRRIGWGILILVTSLLSILLVIGFIMNKPLPKGSSGPEADALARKMVSAVNDTAWDQVNVISWDFVGGVKHLWDRKRMLDRVQWSDNEVFINLSTKTGKAFKNGKEVFDKDAEALLNSAWERWVNDAFWLNPVVKAFDDGVTRSVVQLEDGSEGLMVSYSSGGVTPGDAYLWELDENFRPVAWQLWVKIVPVGGIRFTWEDWQQTTEGAWLSATHEGPFTLRISDIQTAKKVSELTDGKDVFAEVGL